MSDINGRALMRLDDEKLERLGVDHPNHRYELLNEILKQVIVSRSGRMINWPNSEAAISWTVLQKGVPFSPAAQRQHARPRHVQLCLRPSRLLTAPQLPFSTATTIKWEILSNFNPELSHWLFSSHSTVLNVSHHLILLRTENVHSALYSFFTYEKTEIK